LPGLQQTETTTFMSEDLLRYDILTQDALRGMIAKLLDEVTRTGLPGDHHFFITFDTCAPNVQLSSRMREKYPEEMTIVVQHRFWDLEVKEDRFQIGLSFDDIPETLIVPYAAIKGFYDPSVKFGLQFEVHNADSDGEDFSGDGGALIDHSANGLEEGNENQPGGQISAKKAKAKPELFEETHEEDENLTATNAPVELKGDEEKTEPGGAQVVSLDSFRKKK
jgi:hypothetical protein